VSISLLATTMRHFLEVAQTGSITHAADRLHVAMSAVSRQIIKLEDHLGCPLFERKARGMTLTAAGERLLAHVQRTTLDTERVLEEVKGLGGQTMRTIRVACVEGLTGEFFAEVMATYRARHPDASIHLTVSTNDQLRQMLVRGDVDLGCKFSLAKEEGLRIEHQQRAPIMVIAGANHPLAKRRSVAIADIVRYPMAFGASTLESTSRQMLELCCRLREKQYQVAYLANFPTLVALAERGEVLTLMARICVSRAVNARSLVALPVSEPLFKRRNLQILTLRGHVLGEEVRQFRDHLIGVACALG
jgi:DNA-binding transcriptional LysR family regulator